MPTPWALFKEALSHEPKLRFALSVAGIVGLLAIIKSFQIDPAYGAMGVVVFLVLMTGVVVFVRLAASNPEKFGTVVVFFLWASTLLIIASASLLFSSFFFHAPIDFRANGEYVPTAGDQKIWALEGRVSGIEANWTDLKANQTFQAADVEQKALHYASSLESMADKDLGIGGRLIKQEYLCYARIIAANIEVNSGKKVEYVTNARSACQEAAKIQSEINLNRHRNLNYEKTAAFMEENDEVDWIAYLIASTFCTVGTANQDADQIAKSNELLNKLPSSYLLKAAPHQDRIFSGCREEALK